MNTPERPTAEEIANCVAGAIYLTAAAIIGSLSTGAAAAGIVVGLIGWLTTAAPAVLISGGLLGVAAALSVTEGLLRRRIRKAKQETAA